MMERHRAEVLSVMDKALRRGEMFSLAMEKRCPEIGKKYHEIPVSRGRERNTTMLSRVMLHKAPSANDIFLCMGRKATRKPSKGQ
jgi:hypothetical protein